LLTIQSFGMKKDKFIKEEGKTKSPYPIYPNEVRDDETSLGKMKNSDIDSNKLQFSSSVTGASKFFFGLIIKNLKVQ
jgi:hypothetical protein